MPYCGLSETTTKVRSSLKNREWPGSGCEADVNWYTRVYLKGNNQPRPGMANEGALLVYCPIISLTYIYEESYVMRHENSLSHRVVAGRTCGVEHLESRKNFAVAID